MDDDKLDGHLYHDFRIKQLVDDTIRNVLHNATSVDLDKTTVLERKEHSVFNLKKQEDDYFEDSAGEDDSYEIYDRPHDLEDDGSGLDVSEGDLARAHWIQLHKTNKQGIVIQNAFIHILTKYKHIRPVWQFGKKIEDSKENWKTLLYEDFYFRHHCASIQAGLTMVMENKDDPVGMRKLLNEIGAHHFFYDACEPHLEVFQEGMIESMRKVLSGIHVLDANTEESWRTLLSEIKGHLSEGISIQRSTYLKQCLTKTEMELVRSKWERVEHFGLVDAGQIMCETAVKTYVDLLQSYRLSMPLPELSVYGTAFNKFSELTVKALDLTIKSYKESIGFLELPEAISEYVVTCMMLDVCPSLVRKAFMEGLVTMLSKVLGDSEITESFVQVWSKVYRVLEQAVIMNIVEY